MKQNGPGRAGHPSPVHVGFRQKIQVIFRIEGGSQFLLFGFEEKQNVSQGYLAGKTFFSGGVLFTQVKAMVSFQHHCIATETSEGGRNQVRADTIHLRDENGLMLKMKFADAVYLRMRIILVF